MCTVIFCTHNYTLCYHGTIPLNEFQRTCYTLQVLSCVKHILETDKEVKVRQAALTVLKLLIKGLSLDAIQVSHKLIMCHRVANVRREII